MLSDPRQNLERLYEAHADALYAFLLNLTRNEADTYDLLQTVFSRLAAKPELLCTVENPRAFLLRMSRNLFLDLVRKNRGKRSVEFLPEEMLLIAPPENTDQAEFFRAVDQALLALPEEQRAVAHLKLWESQTFSQIAETLGISANTAASRYRYAIDKLRTLLRPIYEEIS